MADGMRKQSTHESNLHPRKKFDQLLNKPPTAMDKRSPDRRQKAQEESSNSGMESEMVV
jgi:hypothetical protein